MKRIVYLSIFVLSVLTALCVFTGCGSRTFALTDGDITVYCGEDAPLPITYTVNGRAGDMSDLTVTVDGDCVAWRDGRLYALSAGSAQVTVTLSGDEPQTLSFRVRAAELAISAPALIDLMPNAQAALSYGVTEDGAERADLAVCAELSGDGISYDADSQMLTASDAGTAVLRLYLLEHPSVEAHVTVCAGEFSVSVPTADTVRLSSGDSVPFPAAVLRDGMQMNRSLTVISDGDSAVYDSESQTIRAVRPGKTVLRFRMETLPEVGCDVTVSVTEEIFGRGEQTVQGDVDLSGQRNGVVRLNGGQTAVLTDTAGTQYVIYATLELPSDDTAVESCGLGSFADAGNRAMWFALRNTNGKADGCYSVHLREFYRSYSWTTYNQLIDGYTDIALGTRVECILVRDNTTYYYAIGPLWGTYESAYTEPTYPGVFSHAPALTVTDFTVAYDAESVSAARDAIVQRGAALVVAQERDGVIMVGGESRTFTAVTYPAADQPLTWEADVSAMVRGAEGVTLIDGVLTVPQDASGSLTVIVRSGIGEDRIPVTAVPTVTAEDQPVRVTGGVLYDPETGVITFPAEATRNDGIVSETESAVPDAMAALTEKVTGDFEMEFTVHDLRGSGERAVLLLSLGGSHNQFYVSCASDGTMGRIAAYLNPITQDGGLAWSGVWMNGAASLSGGFSAGASHTFRIEVAGGRYTVSADGVPVTLTDAQGNTQAARSFSDWNVRQTVFFALSQGSTCRISDIRLHVSETKPTFYAYGGMVRELTDNGFSVQYTDLGWAAKNGYYNTVYSTATLPRSSYTVECRVNLGGAMTDSRLVIRIGGNDYHIINRALSGGAITAVAEGNSWREVPVGVADAASSFSVVLRNTGGRVTFFVNGVTVGTVDGDSAGELSFFAYNATPSEGDMTVTVSDFRVR